MNMELKKLLVQFQSQHQLFKKKRTDTLPTACHISGEFGYFYDIE